jgi:hypothetical protein
MTNYIFGIKRADFQVTLKHVTDNILTHYYASWLSIYTISSVHVTYVTGHATYVTFIYIIISISTISESKREFIGAKAVHLRTILW